MCFYFVDGNPNFVFIFFSYHPVCRLLGVLRRLFESTKEELSRFLVLEFYVEFFFADCTQLALWWLGAFNYARDFV
jgi:hypothetical protein